MVLAGPFSHFTFSDFLYHILFSSDSSVMDSNQITLITGPGYPECKLPASYRMDM